MARSTAQATSGARPQSPALYELRDGEPALVAYDLTEDGLYVARHVLDDGWLQIGDERVSWRFVPRGTFR